MLEKNDEKMHKRKKMLTLHDKKYISLKKNPSQHSILHFIFQKKTYSRVNSHTFNACHLISINSIFTLIMKHILCDNIQFSGLM